MASLIKNIFGNKNEEVGDAQSPTSTPTVAEKKVLPRGTGGKFVSTKTPEERALIEQTKAAARLNGQKKPLLRGAHGKFVSSKQVEEGNTTTKTPSKEGLGEKLENTTPQSSVFYSNPIRKFRKDSIWYFSLLDILPIAKTINPSAYIAELKHNPDSKSILSEKIVVFTYPISEEKNELLECISYDTFMELLPLMRMRGSIFPGPFPGWIENQSKEDYVETIDVDRG